MTTELPTLTDTEFKLLNTLFWVYWQAYADSDDRVERPCVSADEEAIDVLLEYGLAVKVGPMLKLLFPLVRAESMRRWGHLG